MTRLQKIAIIALALMVALTATLLHALPTSALTTAPIEYTQTGFAQWNWPALIKTNQTGHGGGNCSGSCSPLPVTHFDPEDSSYVIFHRSAGAWLESHNPFGNKVVALTTWRLAIAPAGRSLTLKKDLVTGDYLIGVDTGSFQVVDLLDYNGEQVTSGGNTFYGRVSTVSPSTVSSTGDIQHIYAAKNVIYHGSWDAGIYNSFAQYGSDAGQTCSAVDVGCWIAKAWNGVSNTISSVGKAIVSAIANFFAPDTAQIQSDFNSFKAFLDAKLGFLTYPFTFLADVFNAFTGAGNMTCTTSGCVKNFGGFFGGTFYLDFAILAEDMPTLWSYLCALLIGLTILEVIIMIRRKVMGVIHK